MSETSLQTIARLTPPQLQALSRLGIKSVEDLLYHFPIRYGGQSPVKSVEFLVPGETAVIYGKISHLKTSKTFRSRVPISTAEVEDSTGKVKIIWFLFFILFLSIGFKTLIQMQEYF